MRKVTFAKKRQSDHELWLHQAIDVLPIDAVNSLPLDVDKARIAHNHVVVSQFQIDRHFLGVVPGHCCLGILSRTIDQFKARQIRLLKHFLHSGTLATLHAEVVENELEFLTTTHSNAVDLRAKI